MSVSALAHPTDAGHCQLAGDIARQHAILLLEAAEDFLTEQSCGSDLLSVTALAKGLAELEFELVWDQSFGSLYATLPTRDPAAIIASILLIGLRCAALGHMVELDRPIPLVPSLRFGRWTIANVLQVRIEPHAHCVHLGTRNGSVRLSRLGKADFDARTEIKENPVTYVGDRQIFCLFKDNLLCPGGTDIREQVVEAEIELLPPRLSESLQLLNAQSPRYFEWLIALLRGVTPWGNPQKFTPGGSGSSNLMPGIVAIASSPSREPMIDSLIHEICHHYFYLALKLGKVSDDSGELFHNPMLRRDRPISMILLAFHAFANVYRYCREAIDCGRSDSKYFVSRMAVLRKHLPVLDSHLASSRRLTELGCSLWLPLHDDLSEILS